MSTSSRILKNSGYLYLKMAFTVFVNLYSTRLILNALGVSDFGIFGVIGSVLGILGFLNATLSTTTSRFINFYEGKNEMEKLKKVFNNSIFLHLCLAVFLVLIMEIIMPFLFDGILNIPNDRIPAAKMLFHFSVASTFFSVMSVPYGATINAHENMLYFAIIGIIESVAKLIIAIYLTYCTYDRIIVYGFLTMVTGIVILIVQQIYCRIKYEECRTDIKRYYDKSQLKDLLGFSKWTMVSTGGILIGNYGNNVIINYFFGTKLNAAQSVSSQIKGQVMALTTTMTKAMNPAIAKKAGSGDLGNMLKLALSGTKLNILLYCVLGIPFVVEAPYILSVWLKSVPEWTVCFSIFSVSISMIEQFSLTLHGVLIATGNIKQINITNFMTHILPLFVYCVIFSWGAQPYWMYIIYAISVGGISSFADIYFNSKYCGLNLSLYCKDVFFPHIFCIVISIIVGFLYKSFSDEGWIRLISLIVLVDFIYVLLVFFIGLNRKEKSLAMSFVRNLILLLSKFCKR